MIACALSRIGIKRTLWLAAGLSAVALPGVAVAEPRWPDNPSARVAALAILQTLNADLLSHDSATLTLDRWCEDHRLAFPARIVADRDQSADKPPTDAQRQLLRVADSEAVRYRRVRLRCGTHTLSDADNFYVPGRLTPDINRQLDTTDIAFGRAVQPLHFSRHTLSARLLWEPLPQGWDMGTALPPSDPAGLSIPPHVLEHQALLALPDGTPFSLVIERYTADVLDFAPPRAP